MTVTTESGGRQNMYPTEPQPYIDESISYESYAKNAEKLVRLHCRGDKYKLDQGAKPRAVADDLIYNSGNTSVSYTHLTLPTIYSV